MGSLTQRVDDFLLKFAQRFDSAGGEPSSVRSEIELLRAVWPDNGGETASVSPTQLPACAHLEAALALGYAGPEAELALAVAPLCRDLQWTYSYPATSKEPDLSARIAFSQIVGRRGLLPHDRIHIGLTLMAPQTAYPPHVHPAIETYLVLAGSATWQAGSGTPTRRPPGTFILHPSNVAHAMTTDAEPLLAIWTWRGDLASPSVFLKTLSETSTLGTA